MGQQLTGISHGGVWMFPSRRPVTADNESVSIPATQAVKEKTHETINNFDRNCYFNLGIWTK